MDAIAEGRFQRVGPRKVAQVLDEIRGKKVLMAQQILRMTPRACVTVVSKTLESAAANLAFKMTKAGRQLEPERVYVKTCFAGQGPMRPMRRVRPAPMGRAMTFRRKVCHLTVVVSDGRKED
ncbi:MAG: 50S ribosomal protein L22 [Elusimicrobia bacterium]|nr:50S ribosomal protein L22 [Elusimicrobiota bacterium]